MRRALVLGASKGIGAATAVALSNEGYYVVLVARDADRLHSVTQRCSHAHFFTADLDNREHFLELLNNEIKGTPFDIVVHNTGGPPSGALIESTEEQLLHAFSRHLLTAHAILKRTLPHMKAQGWGRFVQILSTSVREPIKNLGASNLTRASMASWSKTMSDELPPGVTINNVLPGYTNTSRLSELAEAVAARRRSTKEQVLADWASSVPEQRLAHASEIAAMVRFLCTEEASYIRGQSIAVDGGRLRSI